MILVPVLLAFVTSSELELVLELKLKLTRF